MSDEASIEPQRLIAEIYADLRQRRESGQIDASIEAEIDDAFERVAPVAAFGGDARVLIERAEDAASIDPHVPIESRSPAITIVKRAMRKTMFWYVVWITNQVGQFAGNLSRAVRLLEGRLTDVESGRMRTPLTTAELSRVQPREPDPEACAIAERHLSTCKGRVVVAEAAAGRLVGRLAAAGHDVVGVEPRADLVALAAGDGITLSMESGRDRLRSLGAAAIDGLVLVGVTERSTPEQHLELADLATAALRPGGRLVVIATSPAVLASVDVPLEIDLSPGRPLAASTWRHLLAARGLEEISLAELADSYIITAARPQR